MHRSLLAAVGAVADARRVRGRRRLGAIRVLHRWPGTELWDDQARARPADRRGTQGKVEAASAGKKLAPKDKGDVDRYNSLLNQYLGARCHA